MAVPGGWRGPVIAREDEPCGGSYGTLEVEYPTDLEAAPASCTCECGALEGASCSAPSVGYSPNSCNVIVAEHSRPEDGCSNVDELVDGYFHHIGSELSGGSCTPTASVEVPPAGFATQVALCSADHDTTGCEGLSICTPPTEGPICVWTYGDQTCPDAFADRRELYAEVEDTRGCSECSCEPQASCDGGHATLSAGMCGGYTTNIEHLDPDECVFYEGTVRSVTVPSTPTPEGSCAASSVQPIGETKADVIVTVCCG